MNDSEKLRIIINEINDLNQSDVSASSIKFKTWMFKTDRFIRNYFGDGVEYKTWCSHDFEKDELPFNQSYQLEYELGLVKGELETYLEEIESEELVIQKNETTDKNFDYSKVFIVHGHDGELKREVEKTINKLQLNAIILSDKTAPGRTIIEKIEKYSDVGAAICLFTNDDEGKEKDEKELKPRARQNVVFEAGFFMGLLGREHVMMICDSNNEIPGDLSGIVYTSKDNWKIEMSKQLKAMGYDIDANNLLDE